MRASAPAFAPIRASLVLASLVLAPLALTSTAQADAFDDKVKAAKPLHDHKSIESLFWSQAAACGSVKNDLLRRQCQGVRDTRLRLVANQTYLVDVGAEALELSKDPTAHAVEVSLHACLECGSEGPVILGLGKHTVEAGKVLAPVLTNDVHVFKKQKRLDHWMAHIAPRLRAQLLVKIPASVETFKVAGRNGYKVEVIAYRLFDPCHGVILAASPHSDKGPVSAAACKESPVYKDEPAVAKVPKNVHPDRLTTAQIKAAMKNVSKQTKACHEAYGIEGMATFKMVIAGSGKLAKSEQTGDFAGTPTGICLDKAIQSASFPKSKKKATPITYPLVLR